MVCQNGCVATSQPLASEIGLRVLQRGGNAADAAVAACAALNVTEPCQSGIGGDAFCLYYDAASKTVRGLNGSGRSPAALGLDVGAARGGPGGTAAVGGLLDEASAHCVTVPGAAACWVDAVEGFGRLTLGEVLGPAIDLADGGFPVHGVAARLWKDKAPQLLDRWGGLAGNPGAASLLMEDGTPPRCGDVLRNGALADTFRALRDSGKKGFYEGRVAEAIVSAVRAKGGLLSLDDLRAHDTERVEPISAEFRGKTVWELPPNGSGLVALHALRTLDGLPPAPRDVDDAESLHRLVEALKLAFRDGLATVGDGAPPPKDVRALLGDEAAFAARRERVCRGSEEATSCVPGLTALGTDTVYLAVVDGDGNACSLICSNYCAFGSGLVPPGCGFSLHNRGFNFVLTPGHPNCLGPSKRPYHTIIPGMVTDDDGAFFAAFGVMGGFMQPQGHVQVLTNVLDRAMDPQAALDAPRFCIAPSKRAASLQHGVDDVDVHLEAGFSDATADDLERRGHSVVRGVASYGRFLFGRGQVILARGRSKKRKRGGDGETARAVFWAGSDPRGDGMAVGY